MTRLFIVIGITLVIGCAHRPLGPSCAAPELEIDPRTITSTQLAQLITRDLLALRCLQAKAPLNIQLLPSSQYLDARAAVDKAPRPAGTPPSRGLYDTSSKTLYVIDIPLDSTEMIAEMSEVLAHEITHAVQHQYLDAMPRDGASHDALLAHRAMLEGDASLVGLAYAARVTLLLEEDTDVPLDRAIEIVGRGVALHATTWQRVMNKHHAEWPARTSLQELHFIYGDGIKLASTVYFIGGIASANKMLARPPISSEQVLYVQKYVDWEEPSQTSPPSVPDGYEMGPSRTFGAIGARVLLSPCIGAQRAADNTFGWDGDRATWLKSRGVPSQILWSSSWDTPGDAERFAAALREAASCVCRTLADGTGDFQPAVRAQGSKVAFACGLADTGLEAAAQGLL